MGIIIALLYVVEVVVCVLLALIVMLQKPKEGGLGGAFGGGALEASLGADAGNVLIKATAILGAVFLLNTLILAKLTSTESSSSVVGNIKAAPVQEAAPQALPELPAAPAPAPAKPAPAKPAPAPAKPAAPAEAK